MEWALEKLKFDQKPFFGFSIIISLEKHVDFTCTGDIVAVFLAGFIST